MEGLLLQPTGSWHWPRPSKARSGAQDVAALLPVLLVAGTLSATFYLLSAGVTVGAMPFGWSIRSTVEAIALIALVFIFTVRHPNALGAMICTALAIRVLGLSRAMEAGYGVHFIGRRFAFADSWLADADRWLGFDWLAMLHWFDRHPTVSAILRVAYVDCGYEVLLAVVVLSASHQHGRLATMIAANFLALIFVHACALVVPAIGAYGFYGLSPADHPHIAVESAAATAHHVLALRQADVFRLPDHPLGLVTFPSYHAVLAIQFAWAFARTRWLCWPAVVVNAAVLVSALPHGSHYLTDLIAGVAVGVASIWVVRTVSIRLGIVLQRQRAMATTGRYAAA